MAVVFLLGPGLWDTARKHAADPTPMLVRRELARVFIGHGHEVTLMEDDPDREGEDYIQKFDRLLRDKVTDVVLYWPPLAKMQTTYDELILLCDRRDFLRKHSIRLWALHHSSVARISKDEFRVLETGNRKPLSHRRGPDRPASAGVGRRRGAGQAGPPSRDGALGRPRRRVPSCPRMD